MSCKGGRARDVTNRLGQVRGVTMNAPCLMWRSRRPLCSGTTASTSLTFVMLSLTRQVNELAVNKTSFRMMMFYLASLSVRVCADCVILLLLCVYEKWGPVCFRINSFTFSINGEAVHSQIHLGLEKLKLHLLTA